MSNTPSTRGSATATATPARYESHFNDSDTVLWNIERDPSLRTTIVAVAVLDRAPDWERLRTRILETADTVPRLRQRVVEAPFGMGPPRWVHDDRFDLDYHLRRVVVPPPGDLDAVLDLAAPMAMAAFDKDRPLWEFTLVEGLQGGRAALIEKIHHAFTDGVGGVLLAKAFVDRQRRPRASRRATPAPAPDPHQAGVLDALSDLASTNARNGMKAAAKSARILPGLTSAALRDPVALSAAGAKAARSVGRLLRPAGAPLSPIMTDRGLARRLRAFDVSLTDALAAAHAAGGTLNDAFLAAVAGGLRRYHDIHGVPVERLRVTMPINLRATDDSLGNNRFTPVRFALPVTDDGPADRMRQLGELARKWRAEPALPISDVIAGVFNRLPPAATTAVFGAMLKGVDLVVTNVPGLPTPVYLAGAEVLRHYAFAPPSGAACAIALMSHGDEACIGVTVDAAAVPDPDVFTDCLREGFDEVLASAPGR